MSEKFPARSEIKADFESQIWFALWVHAEHASRDGEDLVRMRREADALGSQWWPELVRLAQGAVRGLSVEPTEVAAHTYLALIENPGPLDKLREEQRIPRGYLWKMMRRTAVRKYLRTKREEEARENLSRSVEESGRTSSESASSELTRRELAKVARDSIEELPDPYRLTMFLHLVREVPVAEIAEVFQCPAATVWTRIARGRLMLVKKLNSLSVD